jgi:hypothetical protein
MGLRAFIMVNVADEMKQTDLLQAIRDLEKIPGVDFVDPVIGSADMVIMIDAPVTVEAVAKQISSQPWVKKFETLRIVSIYEGHRQYMPGLPGALSRAGV